MSGSLKNRARTCLALAACAVLVDAGAALAADYSYEDAPLRGSYLPDAPVRRGFSWDGIYFGAQAGRTFTNANFGNASSSQLSYILANTELQSLVSDWVTLPNGSTGNTTFGGFAGYNVQWGEIVGSVELNYNRVHSSTSAADSLGPIVVPGANLPDGSTVQYAVTVASSASVAINDVFTARARAGWAYDRYLPYVFGGLAVARADVMRTTSVTGTKSVTTPAVTVGNVIIPASTSTGTLLLPRSPQTESRSLVAYGFTAGLGVDIAVLDNMFIRAEWEYTGFANVDDVLVNLNSVRAGVGVRF
jgi:outer membrane immunogenic protein